MGATNFVGKKIQILTGNPPLYGEVKSGIPRDLALRPPAVGRMPAPPKPARSMRKREPRTYHGDDEDFRDDDIAVRADEVGRTPKRERVRGGKRERRRARPRARPRCCCEVPVEDVECVGGARGEPRSSSCDARLRGAHGGERPRLAHGGEGRAGWWPADEHGPA